MYATLVHVYVMPEYVDDFIRATRENHEQSIKEPGNLRFDVLQDVEVEGKFILYEVYATAEAVSAHKETAHYAGWRDRVAPWMAKPRDGKKHTLVFPAPL